MATIGSAVLQIIPSLAGVTEAIEKQVGGKVVNVTIAPKVDQKATEQVAKQTRDTVEKQTKQIKVEPKVDQAAAQKAGKQAGKTVSDEMASSVKSSSAAKEAAKVFVDGLADGVKREMPRGGVAEVFVDGLADGIKQGIDGVGIGGQVVTTIGDGVRSGNLGGTIRDAVVPAVTRIGDEIRSSAAGWAGNIANSLRSGDIQGATDDIGNTVRNTTDLIADIGDTFGLQLDGVREFGTTAGTTLSQVGGDIQNVVNKANDVSTTLETVGTVLETVLPGKASKGVASMIAEFGKLAGPIAALNAGVDMLPKDVQGIAASTIPGVLPSFKDQGADKPWYEREITADIWRWLQNRGKSSGGYTGSMPIDQVAGVVHGGEYVIKASSTAGIENAMPGLLDYLNNKGALPGFKGGGKVQLGNISGPGITTAEQQSMWDAVRGKFPEAILSSATRTVMTEGHPDFHNAGRAIDISGPGMGSIASWIASNYPDSLELIHSPFGHNIKNGKDVGDGNAYYGAGLMAAHRNHVHWALGKTATPSSAPMLPAIGLGDGASTGAAAPAMAATESSANSSTGQSSGITLASSFSGLAGMYGDQIGQLAPVTSPDGKTQSLSKIGDAAGQFASGQVSSLFGAFGINDSPGWLKGLSTLANGIKIGGPAGTPAAAAAGGDGPAPMVPSIAPLASAATSTVAGFLGGGGVQAPTQQVNYNIQTTDIEPAYLASQRLEKERAAANLARF